MEAVIDWIESIIEPIGILGTVTYEISHVLTVIGQPLLISLGGLLIALIIVRLASKIL